MPGSLTTTNVLVATSSVKLYTGINTTTNDILIEELVPIVLDDIVAYTKNYFIKSTMYFYDDQISFLSSGAIFCTDTEIDLTDWVRIGTVIHVAHSLYNDGFFSCSTNSDGINSSYINLNEYVNAETTSTGKFILLQRVEYPKDLKFIAANMINYILTTQDQKNIASERLGDHSVNYTMVGNNSYPSNIVNGLNKYRKMKML